MSIQIRIENNRTIKENTFITGFHGIGTTGFIALKYIINEVKAKKIGTILSDNLPPFITTKDGKISLPFELFQHNDFVMMIPQFQPYRPEQKVFAEKLVEWCIQSKFQRAILVGGLDSRLRKNENDKIRAIATTAYLKKFKNEIPIIEDGLFVTGPIALILTYYEVNDFPAIALLPYAESSRVDPLAASVAVKEINNVTKLGISIDKLIQDAESIEQNLQDVFTQTKEQDIEDKEQGTRRLYI